MQVFRIDDYGNSSHTVILHPTAQKGIFILLAVACLASFISAPVALFLGIVVANSIGHPFLHSNAKMTKLLLQISVVGLGFGMNINSAIQAGKAGIYFTMASIFGTLALGYLLGKMMKLDTKMAQLISSGTAICGGSAIAAIAPVLQVNEQQLSVSLGTVFILNAVALFLFPAIGHTLHMSQQQFGLWAAIAIHDTSSVVGAASKYGSQALEIATTVKLARALWIVPVSLGLALTHKSSSNTISIPWFIGLFIIAMLLNTYLPAVHVLANCFTAFAKAGLKLTLFMIGCGLSFSMLKTVGIKPLLHGLLLWIAISIATLWFILHWA